MFHKLNIILQKYKFLELSTIPLMMAITYALLELDFKDKLIQVLKNNFTIFNFILDFFSLFIGRSWIYTILPFLVGIFVLFWLRKRNKDKLLCFQGNIYCDQGIWFYYTMKIIGYSKCSLILVPIYHQIKLVYMNFFKEFYYGVDGNRCTCKVSTEIRNSQKLELTSDKCICNIIICDSYPIDFNSQIPSVYQNNYTIIFNYKTPNNVVRGYSQDLINAVKHIIDKLPQGITINLFSTLNTVNAYHLTKDVFSQGERGQIGHLNVFQQESKGKRQFKNKAYKIF